MTTIKHSVKCSRCPREEDTVITLQQAIALHDEKKLRPAALRIILDGEELACYAQLCNSCRSVVCNYLDGAVKQPHKKSSKRVRKAKEKAALVKTPAKSR